MTPTKNLIEKLEAFLSLLHGHESTGSKAFIDLQEAIRDAKDDLADNDPSICRKCGGDMAMLAPNEYRCLHINCY